MQIEKRNFWQSHPELTTLTPFKELHKNDKSRAKENSSSLMWVVWQLCDKQSHIRNFTIAEKRSIIEDDMGDHTYFDRYQEQIDNFSTEYIKVVETPAEKSYRKLEKKWIERADWIDDTPYSDETAKLLDELLKNTPLIAKALAEAKRAIDEEGEQGKVRGDKELSLTDKGAI